MYVRPTPSRVYIAARVRALVFATYFLSPHNILMVERWVANVWIQQVNIAG